LDDSYLIEIIFIYKIVNSKNVLNQINKIKVLVIKLINLNNKFNLLEITFKMPLITNKITIKISQVILNISQ
jgi:hypothetical protein